MCTPKTTDRDYGDAKSSATTFRSDIDPEWPTGIEPGSEMEFRLDELLNSHLPLTLPELARQICERYLNPDRPLYYTLVIPPHTARQYLNGDMSSDEANRLERICAHAAVVEYAAQGLVDDELGLAVADLAPRVDAMLSIVGRTPVTDRTGGHTRERVDLASWAAAAKLLAGGAPLDDAAYALGIHPAAANHMLDSFAGWQCGENVNTRWAVIGRTLMSGLREAAHARPHCAGTPRCGITPLIIVRE